MQPKDIPDEMASPILSEIQFSENCHSEIFIYIKKQIVLYYYTVSFGSCIITIGMILS